VCFLHLIYIGVIGDVAVAVVVESVRAFAVVTSEFGIKNGGTERWCVFERII